MDPLVMWISRRIKNNQNALIAITGGTGSGKSVSATTIGIEVMKANGVYDPDAPYPCPRYFVDAINLLEWVNEAKPGMVGIVDEAGIAAGNRDWAGKRNKAMSKLAQVFRYKNLVLIYCVPAFSMIDVHLRHLMHMHIQTIPNGIDRKNGLCFVKPRELYIDQVKGDIRRRKLRITNPKTKDLYVINTVAVPKPPADVLQYYEATSKVFKDEFLKKQLEALREIDK